MERVCDYNGQSVLVHEETERPLTYHDCGYADCDLCWVHSEKCLVDRTGHRPLNFDRDDWEGAYEWYEQYGEE